MLYSKESALARIWARNVREGKYTRNQVPNLFNLREVVNQILDEENAQ
ncbi:MULTISPECIES: hypothetical protein [unclassified Ureibacillus]